MKKLSIIAITSFISIVIPMTSHAQSNDLNMANYNLRVQPTALNLASPKLNCSLVSQWENRNQQNGSYVFLHEYMEQLLSSPTSPVMNGKENNINLTNEQKKVAKLDKKSKINKDVFSQFQNYFNLKFGNKPSTVLPKVDPVTEQKPEVQQPVTKEPVVTAPVKETPATQQPSTPAPVVTKPEVPASSNNGTSVSAFEQRVLELTNAERAKEGLKPLILDTKLSSVARTKSQDMSAKGYFSHTSPTYGSPFDMMKQFGISYTWAAENIAKGQTTPESVVTAWMNSSGHRANIMSSQATHIGIGHEVKGNLWTQMFIKK